MVIEAVTVPSPRTELLIRAENLPSEETAVSTSEKPPCYMCALGLDVKHTDVLILSQFVRSDGCMLPRRITGLCRRQQKKMGKLVTMAQKAGSYNHHNHLIYIVYILSVLFNTFSIEKFAVSDVGNSN